ncbi:hypothetical protein RIF29_38454 [Crotalaria pallida]|uniref:Uncharacterized protein n=1 Tax=Crotalaria pallida TaxID=3830 RepID=A0AAN9HSD9_CROPI
MGRKRGRPPKTPSSSNKKSPSAEKEAVASSSVEFSLSDEEALEDIDSLTPKKAAELLQSIDLLRQKVQSKIPAVHQHSDINKEGQNNSHQDNFKGVESNKHQDDQTEAVEKTTEKALENVIQQANEVGQASSFVAETNQAKSDSASKGCDTTRKEDKGKGKLVEAD